MRKFLPFLLPLALAACEKTVYPTFDTPERMPILLGDLHAADSVHTLWCGYSLTGRAVAADDLHPEIQIGGKVAATAVAQGSPQENRPQEYRFLAQFRPGDEVVVSAGQASARLTVPAAPDTLSLQMDMPEEGPFRLHVTLREPPGGEACYQAALAVLKKWYDASGRLLFLSRTSLESEQPLFTDIPFHDGTGRRTFVIDRQDVTEGRTISGAVRLHSEVVCRVSTLSRNGFSWRQAWISYEAESLSWYMADPVRFPENVEGGHGLVDISADVERTFVAGDFPIP